MSSQEICPSCGEPVINCLCGNKDQKGPKFEGFLLRQYLVEKIDYD